MNIESLGLVLLEGSHEQMSRGACVMEAVAYIAGEEWSDHPKCACPVIAAFARRLNDRMTNEERVALVPLIPRLAGSRSDRAAAKRRMYMTADWACRSALPDMLERIGKPGLATKARAVAPITSRESALAAHEATLELRKTLRATAATADAATAIAATAYATAATADAGAATDAAIAATAYAIAAYATATAYADAAGRRTARKHFIDSAVGMLRKLLDDVEPIALDDAAWARARELANITVEAASN